MIPQAYRQNEPLGRPNPFDRESPVFPYYLGKSRHGKQYPALL